MVGVDDHVRILRGEYGPPTSFHDLWLGSIIPVQEYSYLMIDIALMHDYFLSSPATAPMQNHDASSRLFKKRLIEALRLMQKEINGIYISLAYLRHGLDRYAWVCWNDQIVKYYTASSSNANSILAYLYQQLITFYFCRQPSRKWALDIQDSFHAMKYLGHSDWTQLRYVSDLLEEIKQLGRTLIKDGPFSRQSAKEILNLNQTKKDLEVLFHPFDELRAVVGDVMSSDR